MHENSARYFIEKLDAKFLYLSAKIWHELQTIESDQTENEC